MLGKIVFFVGCLCVGLAAHADVFSVQKVPVDVTSDSSTHARQEALSKAQKQAFEILIQRITRAEDAQRLEWPPAEDIVNWISDISMSNEKTSPVRYMADVSVRFDAEKIKTWLEEKKVPYMAQTMEPGWVLPVYNGPATDSEEEGDPWVRAWQTNYNSEIVPLSVFQTPSEQEGAEPIQPTGNSFWAIATVHRDRIQIQFKPVLASNTLLSETSLIQPRTAGQAIPWQKLVQKTQRQLEKMWLDKNIVHFDKPSFISVIVPIKDLADWVKTREHLDKIKLIKKYDVRAMRKDQAQIDVYFAGDLDVFVKAMDQENLFLSTTPGSTFWILRDSRTVTPEEKNARILPSQQILFPVIVEEDNTEEQSLPQKIQLRAPEEQSEPTSDLARASPQEETRALMGEDATQ